MKVTQLSLKREGWIANIQGASNLLFLSSEKSEKQAPVVLDTLIPRLRSLLPRSTQVQIRIKAAFYKTLEIKAFSCNCPDRLAHLVAR